MNKLNQLLNELSESRSARFASFTYRSKEKNELSRVTVLLGANHETAYKKDLARLLMLLPKLDGIKRIACQELVDSLKESLKRGIGNNSAFTCKDTYVQTGLKGVKLHPENGELHITGYLVNKQVIEKGEYKSVKSSEKTIAKNELRKIGRIGKIRQYVLTPENLKSVKLNGKTIVIE